MFEKDIMQISALSKAKQLQASVVKLIKVHETQKIQVLEIFVKYLHTYIFVQIIKESVIEIRIWKSNH